MKKIIILIITFFVLFIDYTSANWYGTHNVYHLQGGIHECNDDGDTTWWIWDITYNKDHRVISWDWGLSWYMACQYWDWSLPTWWVSYSITNRTNNNVTIYISCSDAWWSWCNMYGISWWAISGNTYYKTVSSNESWSINLYDIAWNGKTVNYNVWNIDKTPPSWSDITISPIEDAYYQATNSKSITVSASANGGSPITIINGSFESSDTPTNTISHNSSSNTLSTNVNISKVDNNINANNYRDYTYYITKVCDDVWNCANDIRNFTYHVYAAGISTSKSSVSGITNFDDEIADWNQKVLSIALKDAYDNKIIPVYQLDWVNSIRTVTLRWNYDNDLYLDQLNNSWLSWVDSTWFDSSVYTNTAIWTNTNITTTLIDKTNNDWNYDINFKVYSPTYKSLVTDWRQFAIWNFGINNIFWSISDISWEYSLSTWIDFQFKPIYSLNLSWELAFSWFVEWNTQTSIIDINRNWSNNPSSIQWLYFVQTWTWSSFFTWTWTIDSSSPKHILTSWIGTDYITGSFDLATEYIFKTLFVLKDWYWFINNIKDVRLNGYVRYSLWWKVITYLAWILNNINNQNFNSLKIYWITNINSDKQKDLIENQNDIDIHNINWNMAKSLYKNIIRSKVTSTIKYANISNGTKEIRDLSWITWNKINNGWNKLWNILYFWALNWENIELDNMNYDNTSLYKSSWRKTIIVEWWNLFIKSNIINSDMDQDVLWIIVMQDKNWKWWKVYIDPKVQEIDAVIYSDKSIISYSESYDNNDLDIITKKEMDWNVLNIWIENQLYIYWTIFSENTIWGSRIEPAICPFYVQIDPVLICDAIRAERYDLNYLRSWYNNKYNSSYWDYPIIIKYNPTLQSTPPPLFD